MSKRMLTPNENHPITLHPAGHRVIVTAAGKVIADSQDALVLKEASYPPAFYIPRKDVDMALLERTEHESYCPYKGDASYYSVTSGGARSVNAVWTYEKPYEAVAAIREHLAFYPDRVDSIDSSSEVI